MYYYEESGTSMPITATEDYTPTEKYFLMSSLANQFYADPQYQSLLNSLASNAPYTLPYGSTNRSPYENTYYNYGSSILNGLIGPTPGKTYTTQAEADAEASRLLGTLNQDLATQYATQGYTDLYNQYQAQQGDDDFFGIPMDVLVPAMMTYFGTVIGGGITDAFSGAGALADGSGLATELAYGAPELEGAFGLGNLAGSTPYLGSGIDSGGLTDAAGNLYDASALPLDPYYSQYASAAGMTDVPVVDAATTTSAGTGAGVDTMGWEDEMFGDIFSGATDNLAPVVDLSTTYAGQQYPAWMESLLGTTSPTGSLSTLNTISKLFGYNGGTSGTSGTTQQDYLLPLLGLLGGGLLGGLTSSDTTQKSTTSTIPDEIKPYLGNLFQGAAGLLPGAQSGAGGAAGQMLNDTMAGNYFQPNQYNPYGNSFTPFTNNPYLGANTQAISNPFLGQTTPGMSNAYLGQTSPFASNSYIGQTAGQASNPYIGGSVGSLSNPYIGKTVGQASNPYIGRTTANASNPYLGQGVSALSNPYIGRTTANASNSYIGKSTPLLSNSQNPYYGQTTAVGKNPYLGLNNPYLQGAINSTLGDVTSRVNTQFSNPNAWGGSANQEVLQRGLAEASNNMRYQDYALQAQLGEADIARRLQTALTDIGRNAGIAETTRTANQQASLADLTRNSSLAQQLALANQSTQQADLSRNAQLLQQLGMFNTGNQEADLARNAALAQQLGLSNQSTQQADLARNAQLAQQLSQFNIGTQQTDLARNAQLLQQLGMFNTGNQEADLARNAQLAQQLSQFNVGTQQTDLARNAQLLQQLGMFNSGLAQTDLARNAALAQQLGQFNTGTYQTDLARNAALAQQLGQFNAGLYQTDLARNSQLAQGQNQFNANLYQNDLTRNSGLWNTDMARNTGQYEQERNRQFLSATGYPSWQNSWTTAQFSPYTQYANLLKGWGSTTSTTQPANTGADIFGGALTGYSLANMFQPKTSTNLFSAF